MHTRDLTGMDQRLAVHAQRAALLAFGAEARLVAEVVVDAVDHVEPIGPRREQRHRQPWQDGEAAAGGQRARFLQEIVGAEHEAGEPAPT